jgi:hypothetical protein
MNMMLFFSSLTGRLTMAGALLVSLLGLRMWDVNHQRAIGSQKTLAKIERASNANAEKAERARRSVAALPPDGLRDSYRRD